MTRNNLKIFLKIRNCYRPTIKLTAEYSRKKFNFLYAQVICKNNQLITGLYVKSTDTHQYLDTSSCHVCNSNKSIPYSQTLRLNGICSENKFFDKRSNDLEMWLRKRGYNNGLVRQRISKARKFKISDLKESGVCSPKERVC